MVRNARGSPIHIKLNTIDESKCIMHTTSLSHFRSTSPLARGGNFLRFIFMLEPSKFGILSKIDGSKCVTHIFDKNRGFLFYFALDNVFFA